jgi:outer membrane protein assembly factor BamB
MTCYLISLNSCNQLIRGGNMNKSGNIRVIRGVLPVFLVLLCAMMLASPVLADGGAWPQFHNDTANTGATSSSAPNTNHLKWSSTDIGALPSSSPAIANGKVFINCRNALTCLSESSGAVLWTQPITASSVWGSWSSPAYDDGKVFIATDKFYCFSENGGSAVWTYDIPHDAGDGSVAVADGHVIAGDWDGHKYFCLNETTGLLEWQHTVTGYAQGTPAIVDGKVYLTSWANVGGNVYCLDITTGSEVWHTTWLAGGDLPDWDTCGSPCVADGKVFITTYNFYGYGELVALNAADGSFAWDGTAGGRVREIERSDSTPAYYNGKLYISGGCVGYSDDGERTYCFNAADGSLAWRTAVDALKTNPDIGNWTCSPAVADGKVFAGKPNSDASFDYAGIYALDAASGDTIWSYEHGGSSPAICNGVVFTIDDGKVWAFGSSGSDYPAWDVNQDGSIDVLDLILVGNHFAEAGDAGWIPEDVKADGNIDVLDLIIIGNHFGE